MEINYFTSTEFHTACAILLVMFFFSNAWDKCTTTPLMSAWMWLLAGFAIGITSVASYLGWLI
jgi:hypothetical protein